MPDPLDVQAIITSSRSDVGRTRSENQDSCGDFLHLAGARLLILADGMGGHKGGRRASRTCVDAFARVFKEQEGSPEQQLRDAFALANDDIYTTALEDEALRGMGTTGVALLLAKDGSALVGWVGDSRAYRLREGVLEQLTRDHSLVAEWVRMGVLNSEEAKTHPRRSELTRAIGVQPDVEPEIDPIEVRAGDRFLLCSDGLSGLVVSEHIGQILGSEEPAAAVEALVDRANALGGTDNVSVQIALLPTNDESFEGLVDDDGEEADPAPAPRVVLAELPPPPPTQEVVITEPRGLHGASAIVGAAVAIVLVTIVYLFTGFGDEPDRIAPEAFVPPELRQAPAPDLAPAAPDLELADAGQPPVEPAVVPPPAEPVEEPTPPVPVPAPALAPSAPAPAEPTSAPAAPAPAPAAPAPEPEVPAVPDEAAPAAEDVQLDAEDEHVVDADPVRPPDDSSEELPGMEAGAPVVAVEIPTLTGFMVPDDVRNFLNAWLQAAATRDFALYHTLGFPDPPGLFNRTYARWEGFRFEDISLDATRSGDDKIYLRAVLSYAFEDETGRWRTEDEHRLILRRSADGLRYQARWID